jgi:hypothetical protein
MPSRAGVSREMGVAVFCGTCGRQVASTDGTKEAYDLAVKMISGRTSHRRHDLRRGEKIRYSAIRARGKKFYLESTE